MATIPGSWPAETKDTRVVRASGRNSTVFAAKFICITAFGMQTARQSIAHSGGILIARRAKRRSNPGNEGRALRFPGSRRFARDDSDGVI
jgi:hypothetical protein